MIRNITILLLVFTIVFTLFVGISAADNDNDENIIDLTIDVLHYLYDLIIIVLSEALELLREGLEMLLDEVEDRNIEN